MKRVLVVEDDISLCLQLSDMLNEFGFETGVADTAARALNMLNEADPLPDLMLIDGTMPNGDSERLTEVLRTAPRYRNIPIVTMAGGRAYLASQANTTRSLQVREQQQLIHEVAAALH